MKLASLALATLGALAVTVPLAATPASAEIVRKSVSFHGGGFHGCKTVRVVKQGFGGRRVSVRKICH